MSFLDFPDDDPRRARRRPLLLFVLATLAVGTLASLFSAPAIPGWYAGLVKPSFTPPAGLFAPVWTLLYVLMAVAAWRVWRVQASEGRRRLTKEMILYGVQLVLNLGWTVLLFALRQIGLTLLETGVLFLVVLATTILFWRQDRTAGLLFLPYLAWTGFVALLTGGLCRLNH